MAWEQTEVGKNVEWFEDNEGYERKQQTLEYYRLIRLMVSRELKGQKRVLDVGNGGFFNYDTNLAEHVTAVDLFLKNGPGPGSNTTFRQGSILELPFQENSFDCIVLQNVLHHVTGKTVDDNFQHLARSMQELYRCTSPGGKVVMVESTVGRWFNVAERMLFPLLLAVKKWGHPVTFQFTAPQIIQEALKTKFVMVEWSDVPSRGLFFLQMGYKWPTCLSPARAVKLVFVKGT